MFGLVLLFSLAGAVGRKHGRQETTEDNIEYLEEDQGFLDENMGDENPNQEPETVSTLADRYLKNFDKLETQGQKYQAIIWALTELASLIDSAATRYEIEYEIGGHLHTVLNSVDVRDREMKKQFKELQTEVDQLKSDIDKLVNDTRTELQTSMKNVRKDIIKSLRDIVANSIESNHNVAQKVQKKVEKSVEQYKKTTTTQAVSYFVGFQVLLFLCVYFYSKYIQQVRIG
ncbi:hypothetical protein TVAG_243310 [Trichomonas vaginalis G3]|uniref:Uncharacterized protein n=1 Tax=Trichomonas vaginalis (strain ATCC PRA-98 / G3) TaxID=412133 RepID=A2FI14_TRIV3|nr:hypothetical protein TVAGG3_0076230 [Trichomonas vaginalis G3]EAX95442.1 hypothetical protein TVAG_243310 [Trichomonas vaginalis G3]KAI5542881.1 hypothetical protein TVAGG3_0076230 [Trichomonas vaginalis G3]|eukprot:XP_001308372.1 hypothetical protein [Trichomonas vaginalis G3]